MSEEFGCGGGLSLGFGVGDWRVTDQIKDIDYYELESIATALAENVSTEERMRPQRNVLNCATYTLHYLLSRLFTDELINSIGIIQIRSSFRTQGSDHQA